MAHDFLINKIIGENADSNFPLVLFGDKTIAVALDGTDIKGCITLYTGITEYIGESDDIIDEIEKCLDEKSAHTPIFFAPNIDYTNIGLAETYRNVALYRGNCTTTTEVKTLGNDAYLTLMEISINAPINIGDPIYIYLNVVGKPLS